MEWLENTNRGSQWWQWRFHEWPPANEKIKLNLQITGHFAIYTVTTLTNVNPRQIYISFTLKTTNVEMKCPYLRWPGPVVFKFLLPWSLNLCSGRAAGRPLEILPVGGMSRCGHLRRRGPSFNQFGLVVCPWGEAPCRQRRPNKSHHKRGDSQWHTDNTQHAYIWMTLRLVRFSNASTNLKKKHRVALLRH